MIGVFRWGYGADFESIVFWGWVEEGLERGGFVHSIVAGRSACLIAHDIERRREVLRSAVMKCVSAPNIRSASSPDIVKASIIHKQRKAALCNAGSVFKTESNHPVQKNIAQGNRSADIKTAQGVAESGTKTKTIKR